MTGYQIGLIGEIPGHWAEYGLCAQTDPETFFPEKGSSTAPAKAVCQRCPVAVECLEFAVRTGERFGVWGGMSERDRRLAKQRATRGAA